MQKVDEKKVKEAIGRLQVEINAKREMIKYNKAFFQKQDNSYLESDIEVYCAAIEALEKQLPKKVKMRTEYRDLNDKLICYDGFCPNCGKEVNSYRNKSCSHCTQMLDWSEAH